jgi:putative membrane protein
LKPYSRHLQPRDLHLCILAAAAGVFVWSAIGSAETFTWFLEVFPAILAAIVLIWMYPRFRFTTLIYVLIAIHGAILMVGGHYMYAYVPLFDWLKAPLHLHRNYYDRLGHFVQGFIPAMITREVLLRKTRLERGKMLFFLIVCVCMAISAWYEIVEFAIAKVTGAAAENFLGTQGDVWDTQWDMTMAFFGALLSPPLLARWHDRQLKALLRPA